MNVLWGNPQIGSGNIRMERGILVDQIWAATVLIVHGEDEEGTALPRRWWSKTKFVKLFWVV